MAIAVRDIGFEFCAQVGHLFVEGALPFGQQPDLSFESFGDDIEVPARAIAFLPHFGFRRERSDRRRQFGLRRGAIAAASSAFVARGAITSARFVFVARVGRICSTRVSRMSTFLSTCSRGSWSIIANPSGIPVMGRITFRRRSYHRPGQTRPFQECAACG